MALLPFVLKSGEDFFSQIKEVIKKEKIESGIILNGLGMLKDVKLGYFTGHGIYKENFFKGEYEVVSLSGNISKTGDNETIIHIHTSIADKEGNVYGGHLIDAKVWVGIELTIAKLENFILLRTYNKDFNLKLMQVKRRE